MPTRKDLDWRLITGAGIFGIGWGWAGICPGPGIVATASGIMDIIIFIAFMLVGMGLFKLIENKIK